VKTKNSNKDKMKAKKVFSKYNSPSGDGGKISSFTGLGLFVIVIVFFSCKAGPYINHDLKAERIGDCSATLTACTLTENTNGEHYEFNRCLAEDFNTDDYLIERKGDTLVVTFPKEKLNETKALYKLHLDIHANPKYNYIKLGTEVLQISAR
jgi:hypothetical protein